MKIRGRTIGTTMPRSDWSQTDPTRADYIRNKPDITLDGIGAAPASHTTNKNNPHGVTAAQVGATPASHAANKDNPHDVTIKQIGAAPDGYGLGGNAASLSDCNSTVSGIYKWDSAASNRPFDYGTALVLGRDSSSGSMVCIGVSGIYKGVIVVRTLSSEGWIEEYVNPPLEPNVEYRTTERRNGKSVYKKRIDLGNVPAPGSSKSVSVNLYNDYECVGKIYSLSGGNSRPLPAYSSSGAILAWVILYDSAIELRSANSDLSASYGVSVDVSYTKP